MAKQSDVLCGMEVLLSERLEDLRGARAGVLAVPAAVDRSLVHLVDRLLAVPGVRLAALFGPEHGIRGHAQAGEHVPDGTDPQTGLPAYSLYGTRREPPLDVLRELDVLLVDLFDVGCRYWTYPYTLAYAMKACAEAGTRVVVLDRPNPITGLHVEGNLPDPDFARAINGRPVRIPIRTGLTLGELALLFNRELALGADLSVVPCRGWRRGQWYDETPLPYVPPSPNTPTLDTLTVYPGTCLIEGTNVSEGRGTTRPFELIGAPWIRPDRLAAALNERQLPGVAFRPTWFVPAFSKHQGQLCGGVQVHVTDRERLHAAAVGVHLLHALREHAPEHFAWRPPYRAGGMYPIDHLYGSPDLRRMLDAGYDPERIMQRWEGQLHAFTAGLADLRLYPA